MSIQVSLPNDIKVVEGNGLAIFLDSDTNLITLKDSNGIVQTLDNYILQEGITEVIAGCCLTGGGTSSTVTLNHADTSSLDGFYGQPSPQDGCYIKSVTVDGLGHLTAVTSANFDTRYLGINACACDSAQLNSQDPNYYLNFNNFFNVPALGDITEVCATDGIGGGGSSGIVTICNTDKGSNQNIVKRFVGNCGNTYTAQCNNDLLCIVGTGGVSTCFDGNKVTISSTTVANNCQIEIAGGTGLSGGGCFNLNQTSDCTLTLNNTDKGSDQNIFKNVAVSGENTITAGSNASTLTLVEGAGIDITTCTDDASVTISSTATAPSNCQIQISGTDGLSGNATFTLNQSSNGSFSLCNTDKGSDQCFFQNIAVVGSCTISADVNADTVCFSAGTGITLTSDDTQDLITIGTTATGCTGTVTQVCVQSGTTGTDFNVSGSPITTSGTITLNLPTASATNRGALSSADWTTFNSKTNCTGTVTSVSFCTAEGGTDINVSGSPITTNGEITLNIPIAGATKTGKLLFTDWIDFNNKVDDVTAGTGISVSGTDTIQVTNTDRGSEQCIFKTFAVSGQDDIVADSNSDTVTFAGSGIAITTDENSDTITFTVTDAGGTVTEICGAVGTSGSDFNVTGSPITTNGTLTFNLPDASATSRGALTSADWTTFNSKTDCTGTVTSVQIGGGEGIVATGTNPITTSGTINLAVCLNELTTTTDNDCGTYFAVVDSSGVQSKLCKSNINNSGFNNDAGYTSCGGTVTSVGLSAGTGVSVSGSPVTSSGTMTVTNTDRGSSQCIFKNIAVSGQTTIEADSNADTLTFAEGTGITITTDASTDTVTISNEGADGTVTCIDFATNETGTDVAVSGVPITTSGTITLSIPEASATATGKLTATDWTSFNAKTTCTGTVTSIGLTTGTTGTDINVSGSPVTGSGDITLNIPTASATNRGALSSADWTSFNAKTTCTGTVTSVGLTTDETGTDVAVSGSPVTGSGDITISIPIASATNTGKLSNTDWTTFNSKTDCTGTVTSVGAVVGTTGTDFNISGSPVTGSGDITFNLPTASATNRGALSSADWTAFNSKTDCTGTVTSVAIATDELGTDVAVSGSPITGSGTVTISIPEASATKTGKLTSTDWSTFNSKTDCTGTVTSVGLVSGGGLSVSGSPITSSGDITVTNTDKGSDQCIFKCFVVSGQDTIEADSNSDAVTFAGSGIAITTDDTTDTITFTVTDAGGTVTEICGAVGTTGTDFNVTGSPITSSGTLTFNLPTASATNRGALSSSDWTSFNSKVDDVTAGAGISVTGSGTKTVTNTTCIFKNIASTGQTTLVADSLTDTLNIEAGTGVSITTDDSTDTLTIANTVSVSDCTICIQAGSGLGGGGDFTLNQNSGETVTLTNSDKGSSQCIFKNIAVSGQTTIEADNNNDTLTFAGSGIAITTDDSTDTVTFTVTDAGGTVTSVGAVACTTGTDISVTGSPITSSGEFCINIPTASATSRGALSSTDWTTFNNKTTCTGTVTSVSGGTGLTGTVTSSGSIAVDYAGSDNIMYGAIDCTGDVVSTLDCLILNQNSSDNVISVYVSDLPFSNCTGSVTEVCGAVGTAGTDFNVTGSPITGAGTLTFNLPTASATNRGALSNTDWSTFNSKTTCVGTVTSVGITSGGGLSVSGSPITTNGDITVTNTDKGSSQCIFKNIVVSGEDTVTAETNNDSLTLIAGTNMSISTNSTLDSVTFCSTATACTGTVTSVGITAGTGISVSGSPITSSGSITVCNTDKGSSQCIFKTLAVSGQDDIIADSNSDTVTFVGSGIAITTDNTTDTMTFTVTDAGGTVTCVCTTAPLTGGNFSTTGTIGITEADATTDGYLSSTDWSTFNSKTDCTGTVTSVGLTAGSGISVSGSPVTGSGSMTVTNSDKGSDQCIFKCVAVAGQSTIVADSNTDTLTMVGGDNVTLLTNASSDTLTICTISTTCEGTVCSVGLVTNETGTDVAVSGSPITSSGNITLSIPEASATATGKLSSTDWSTFNSKTDCVGTVTSVGLTAGSGITVSGSPVTGSGSMTVTNSDKGSDQCIFKCFAVSGQNTVVADSNTDTLTFVGSGINITTDNSTDTITFTNTDAGGTVTEVCAETGTSGTDFAITGSPITTNGTLTFNLPVASASATGKLSSTDWNTFNNKTSCTGTVTGVTGAGGLCGNFSGGSGSICVDYAGGDSVISSAPNCTGTTVGTDFNILLANSTSAVGFYDVADLPFTNCGGSVTSVGITAGTGISVSGSPITSSGSITVCNTDKGSSQCIFKSVAVAGQTTITADSNADTLTLVGSGIAITTDDSSDTVTFTVTDAGGTVCSVGLCTGTSGTDINVSNTPITSSGNITLNVPTASASNRGALSSTDWSTFNNKLDDVTAGVGIEISGSGNKTICNCDRGSAQCIFKKIAVSGQSTISADSNDDTLTFAGSGITITTNDTTDTVTFTATQGDITCVGAGVGLTGGGTTGDVCLCVDYGSSGLIADAPSGTGTPDSDDCILVGKDASGSGETRSYVIGDLPFTNCLGDITCVGTGVGLTGGGTSGNVTVCVDYAGTNNIIACSPCTATGTLSTSDCIMISNDATNNVTKATISLLPFSNCQGDITGVTAGTGLSGGGTSGSVTLCNADKGSSQNIFKNVASDSGTAVADNNNDTLSILGGTGISTSVTGDTLTITSSGTSCTGTVTSVSGGIGLTGTVTSSGSICVDYAGTDNIILSATNCDTTAINVSNFVMISNHTDNKVQYHKVGELPFSNCSGTVTSVGITAGSGISVSGSPITSSGSMTVTNSDKGSSQCIFKNIAVSGQSTISADSNADTLTFVGSGVTITTNASTDTVTFTATQGDITGVSADGGLCGGGTVGSVTLCVDYAGTDNIVLCSPYTATGTLNTTDSILVNNGGNCVVKSTISNLPFSNCQGDITGVTATGGLCGGGSSGAVSVQADYDGADNIVLASGTTTGNIEPEFRILASADDNVVEAYCVSELPFSNCSGTVTSVSANAGTGINITGDTTISTSGAFTVCNTDRGSSQCIFKNVAVSGQSTIQAESNSDTLTIVGSGIDITTNASTDTLTFTVNDAGGTVTEVCGAVGTSGTDFNVSGSPITGAGTLTFNLPTASATNTGKLSSTDWSDFNNKVDNVTAGTGISVSGTDTITVTNSDRGSSQCIFKCVAVSGQNTVVADSNTDTLTFVGSGVTITTDNSTDTITFTANQGDITSVGADGGLCGGGSVGAVTLCVDYAGTDNIVLCSPYTATGTLNTSDEILVNNGGNCVVKSSISLLPFTSCTGDITAITVGTGLDGGGTSGDVNIDLDLNEISAGGTLIGTDKLIAVNGTANATQVISSIPLSIFDNDANFTSCVGDITGVTAGSGLSGGGTSGSVTLTNSDKGSDQCIFKCVASDSGTAVADSNTDTLSIVGGTGISTSVSGDTLTITSSGTACTGTVTQVCGAVGTSGTDFSVSGSPITGSGTLTFNLPTASASNRGALSSADWSDFNDKVDNVTAGTGISVSGTDTIQVTNSDRGSSQCIFKSIAVSGQNTINADSNSDTLTFVGSGVTITTDSSTDTVTFTATQGDITGVTAGVGLTGGGTTGSLTLCVDYCGTDNIIACSPCVATGNFSTADCIMVSRNANSIVTRGTIGNLPFTNCLGDITNVSAGTGLSGGGTSGSVTLCNADKGSSQNIFKNVASDSGTAVADNNNDTLSILGGTGISTSVSGDTLTITSSGTTCTGTVTSVGITAGSGISVSGSPITSNGSMTVTNNDRGSSQNIFKNVASDSGTAVADSNNDTLSILGGTNISTSVSGDTVTITSSATTCTGDVSRCDSVANYDVAIWCNNTKIKAMPLRFEEVSSTDFLLAVGKSGVTSQVQAKNSKSSPEYSFIGDKATGLINSGSKSGWVGFMNGGKDSLIVDDNLQLCLNCYTATNESTSGNKLNPNQSSFYPSSATITDLGVDSSGKVVRGEQEATWKFTRTQLNGTLGCTLLEAGGSGKFVVITGSTWMAEYNGNMAGFTGNDLQIKQANNQCPNANVSTLTASQLAIMGTNISTNGSFGITERDLPITVRTYRQNTATTLNKTSSVSFPTALTAVYIKLKYRFYDQTTFI